MASAEKDKVSVGIVDDHHLFVRSLGLLVNSFDGFETRVEALNGEQILERLKSLADLPDILLIDVNMPGPDGIYTASVITEKYPLIKLVALSMNDDDLSIIGMIRAGCCAYLLKGIHPTELERALKEVAETGYYNGDTYNTNYRRLLQHKGRREETLNERELVFLKLSCSELTYKEVAAQMHLSERTIDGYRESVFAKLKVQSRVGMVLEALRLKLVKPDE